jgi:hypothetical protein
MVYRLNSWIQGLPMMAIATSAVVTLGAPASAFTIVNSGQASLGSPDPNFTVVATPSGSTSFSALVLNPPNSNYLVNNATSRWIGPAANAGTTNVAAGTYAYQTTFNLSGFIPSTATFQFRVAVDNQLTDVLLNGNGLGVSYVTGSPGTSAAFQNFSSWFTVGPSSSFFNGGVNTLRFNTLNLGGTSGSPTGIRVEFQNATATVPVPPQVLGTLLVGAWQAWKLRKRFSTSANKIDPSKTRLQPNRPTGFH